jgi:predicted Zn-ribbon and HTH transcriptional regulator
MLDKIREAAEKALVVLDIDNIATPYVDKIIKLVDEAKADGACEMIMHGPWEECRKCGFTYDGRAVTAFCCPGCGRRIERSGE